MESRKVTFERKDNIPIMAIDGDMTYEIDADVMAVYSSLSKESPISRLIINFEKTSYINSAGIATLINIIQDLGESGGKVSFVGLSNHFRKVMDIVGISDFVDIFDSNDEALAK